MNSYFKIMEKKIYYKKRVWIPLLLLAMWYSISSRKMIINQDTILIGMMGGWPPYMSINNQGNIEGFDVDVVRELAKVTNKKIEIQDLGSLGTLFMALEKGKVDAIMSGLDITEKRKKMYDVILYRQEKLEHLVVISHSELVVDNLKNRSSLQVGIESGTSWENALDWYGLPNRISLSSIPDLVLQLQKKKLDAIIVDEIQYRRIASLINDFFVLKIFIPQSFVIDGVGIIIKKENAELKAILQQGVKTLYDTGVIKNLEKKWGLIEG